MANGNPPIPPLISDLGTYLRPISLSTSSARVLPDCSIAPLSQYGICNVTMSIHDRASSFVNEFTLQEKVNASVFDMAGIPRLGLPHMNLWNEGLHGLANAVGTHFNEEGEFSHATSFALPILLAAAFDDELVYTVADTISTETRAYGNNGYAGLDLWTPNVNPFRDPRWGRGLETPGEDVFRISEYAKAVIRGFQGPEDAPHRKVVATCKHAVGNDIENVGSADKITRYNYDAKISLQDQADYYMRPFETCVRDAKADSLMCAYNAVNGIPQCADEWLMQTLIRDYWGWNWTGTYITSDCFALDTIQHPTEGHNYTTNVDDTLSLSLRAGTDTECGVVRLEFLEHTLKKDPTLEGDLDMSLIRVFESLIKVGYFDPGENQPYRSIGWKDVNTPDTQKLAVDSAAAGMTLLKNDNKTLPITKPETGKLSVALVGDWANATIQMLGGYFGPPPFYVSPIDALAVEDNVDVKYVLDLLDREGIKKAAESSDIILYVGGLDISNEHEMRDRYSLGWNATQTEVIQVLADLDTPLVLVQTGGGQIDDSAWLNHSGVSSILWIGYPGQAGGQAMCDVLFGRHAPAGRLPITQYPASFADVPPTLQGIRPDPAQGNPGQTYQWYTGTAVLPFGYGLHYTTFDVTLGCSGLPQKILDISDVIAGCASSDHLDQCTLGEFTISVQNSGSTKSSYAALAFVSGEFGPAPRPNKTLVAYKKFHDITPGCRQQGTLGIRLAQLARFDAQGRRVLYPGTYRVAVDVDPEVLSFNFELMGAAAILEEWPAYDREAPPGL